ncbi:Acetyltransferase, GNAT family protein [Flavobacterium daejeonense]|nr:Acetyltransferase, GNAT family protein [Flavobacterium daejeonense]
MKYQFRKARITEIPQIWDILQKAIHRRKKDGSEQWQDGYPNPEVIENDIKKEAGFVLTNENEIIGYTAVLINDEPEYANIIGKWLTNEDFVVFHRVAIAEDYLGRGFSKIILKYIEEFALSNKIYSLKADTNFDNLAMLHIFEKLGYQYCGEVFFRGSARKAFEKVLDKSN